MIILNHQQTRKWPEFQRDTIFRAPVVAAPHSSPKKKHQRKQRSNESVKAALHAVKHGMGINKAAELHGIPKTTLKDKISGHVVYGSKSGPKSYLTRIRKKLS